MTCLGHSPLVKPYCSCTYCLRVRAEYRANCADRRQPERAPSPTGWMKDAACKGQDMNRWFIKGIDGGGSTTEDYGYATARVICARCEVRFECLDFAVREGIEHGMWGGLSPKERRRLA